jgi:hypothetical protein
LFDKFPKYHMRIVRRIQCQGRQGRHFWTDNCERKFTRVSNESGVGVVNFATSKNMTVKSTMLPHRRIHKYIWTFPEGKTHNQIDLIVIDRPRHPNVIDVRSFRATNWDTEHYMVLNVRERLTANKQRFVYGEVKSEEVKWCRG